MTKLWMLRMKIPVLRVQIKVKDEPEDVLEEIIGTGTCDDC